MKQRTLLAAVLALAWLWPAQQAAAHPLGQNAFNREAGIVVGAHQIQLHYLLDLAEIPSVAAGEDADANHDGDITDSEWQAYCERWAQTLPAGLDLSLDGRHLPLALGAHQWAVKPGTAGFSTLRLQADLSAPVALGSQTAQLDYRDQTRADRLGWKEVWIAAADGANIVSSEVAAQDRSRQLSDFGLRDGAAPPDQLTAAARVRLALADKASASAATSATAPSPELAQAPVSTPVAESATAPRGSLIWSFFRLGMHHIATGWDHLMFLLGLVLLCANLPALAKTITAFTLAHSVTLALAAENLVRPPGAWVEALIALTIAYVGIIALRRRQHHHGAWLAFGFGLVHGFGFAGALAESLGASQSLRLIGLVSFNLGIETFQLMLVALVVPALRLMRRYDTGDRLHIVLAGAVSLAGTGWLLMRTIGSGPLAGTAMVAILLSLAASKYRKPYAIAQPIRRLMLTEAGHQTARDRGR